MQAGRINHKPNFQSIYRLAFVLLMYLLSLSNVTAQQNIRRDITLNTNWKSIADDNNNPKAYPWL
jgi:beta-galactosidase